MITYEDLLARFAKVAEDRFGAGGILPSQADVNAAQGAPSHDAKEKADLPTTESHKHTFDSGKCVKGPEEPKINKNIFMTRSGDSTVKKAQEVFDAGFFSALSKEAKVRWGPLSQQMARESAARGAKVTKKEVLPGLWTTDSKMPSSLGPKGGFSERSLAKSRAAMAKPTTGPNPLLQALGKHASAFVEGFLDELE
jgi:hypothetical protein